MGTMQANDIREATRDLAQSGKERATEVANRAGEALNSATTTVGRSMERAGAAIKAAGDGAGTSIGDTGRYLQSADLRTMRSDLMTLCSRHPGATLAVGIGAGLLLAQILTPRRAL